CMGIADRVGSLVAGKKADIVMVDLKSPAMSPVLSGPVRNIIPNLVYSASGSEVDTVIIDGNMIVENGKMLTVDENSEIERAHQSAAAICGRLEKTGWQKELPLALWTEEGYY
ncbi:MAG: amidohydrolase family protein, partial [Bacillota bacterium]|nr:amidohydrolase family protein [Bacillota bacterium]